MISRRQAFLVGAFSLILAAPLPCAPTDNLNLLVRDRETHRAVSAAVRLYGPEARELQGDERGRVQDTLPAGEYGVEVSAPGYQTLRTYITVMAPAKVQATIMLDGLSPAEEQLPERREVKFRVGQTLVDGYIVDAEDGKPLRHVSVRLINSGTATQTDDHGYYELAVATPPEAGGRPGTETLLVQLPGYRTIILRNFLLTGEDAGFTLDMQPGKGIDEHDLTHKLFGSAAGSNERHPAAGGHPISAELREWLGTRSQAFLVDTPAAPMSLAITVPSSIRVGTNCPTTTTCAKVLTYSLEGYVQQGLGQEWISSWDANALRAGAVAYRTRGAYFHNNPLVPGEYDICDTAECQLFWPVGKPSRSIISAANATAGVVLSKDSVTIFDAEYSAEGNLASDWEVATCPDGQVGEPSNGWPCMKDPLCAGKSESNTHSRGMCQWGSQRWATGKNAAGAMVTAPRDWRCILDHYYNANSNSSMVDPTNNRVAGTGERTAFLQNHPTYGRVAYVDTLDNNIRALNAADGSGDALITAGSWSPDWALGGNRLAYMFNASPSTSTTSLGIVNADGTGRTQITTGTGGYMDALGDSSPAWSPSGDKIAYWSTASGSGTDIWTVNADGSNPVKLTSGLLSGDAVGISDVSHISWAPDGRKIAFSASPSPPPQPPPGQWAGSLQLFVMNADGTELKQLTNCQSSSPGSAMTGFCVNPSWSPDGQQLVYTNEGSYSGVGGIYVMDIDGTNVKRLTVANQTHHWYPSWSTDGGRIIFEAMSPTSWTMYSMKADGTDWVPISGRAKWQFNGYLNCSRCPRFDQ